MNPRKPSQKRLRPLCAQVHPDDGLDPKLEARGGGRKKTARKAHQLCHQVAETLNQVLAGESGDDVLRGLQVLAVEPAPDASRLLVTVGSVTAEAVDPALALEHLDRAVGRLRCEVAAAIVRKRAPTLAFRFAVAGG